MSKRNQLVSWDENNSSACKQKRLNIGMVASHTYFKAQTNLKLVSNLTVESGYSRCILDQWLWSLVKGNSEPITNCRVIYQTNDENTINLIWD